VSENLVSSGPWKRSKRDDKHGAGVRHSCRQQIGGWFCQDKEASTIAIPALKSPIHETLHLEIGSIFNRFSWQRYSMRLSRCPLIFPRSSSDRIANLTCGVERQGLHTEYHGDAPAARITLQQAPATGVRTFSRSLMYYVPLLAKSNTSLSLVPRPTFRSPLVTQRSSFSLKNTTASLLSNIHDLDNADPIHDPSILLK
jgi:hypothetical protein